MSIWTNTFVNLNKYIWQFEQIHLSIQTNTFGNLSKYILKCKKNTFANNTNSSLSKYNSETERLCLQQGGHSPLLQRPVLDSLALPQLPGSNNFRVHTLNWSWLSLKNHPNTYKGSLCKNISILWDYRGKQTTGQLLSPVYWVYRFISLPPWDIKLRQSLFKIRSTQLPGEIWDLDIPPGPHQVWCHTTAGMVKIMVYYENINWLNLDSQNIQAPDL